MGHVPATAIADQARKHLGEAGPLNTCVSNGMERWPHELGLPGLGTNSVTQARTLAKAGHNGWSYHEGTHGIARGNFGDWDPGHLGNPDARHVTAIDEIKGDQWRGIGSGTPSGTVARQPASGGFNPLTVLVGYFIAPTETTGSKPAVVVDAPKAPAGKTKYTVRKGDYLARIAKAHHTTVPAILKANPKPADGKTRDYHIVRASLILVGQHLWIP